MPTPAISGGMRNFGSDNLVGFVDIGVDAAK